jgi:tetratricopeptide (TPR) repeat protein
MQLLRRIHYVALAALTLLLITFICLTVESSFSADAISFDELNRMEVEADDARELYWKGDYQEAAEKFEPLIKEKHPSHILYLQELSACYLAMGEYVKAREMLAQTAMLHETFFDLQREQRALSKFGKEEEKVYHGDPYEQATSFALLALLFMDQGDYDNALAAAKSGIFADSDATENLYDSDFTLLHLIEAKAQLMRGEADSFVKRRDVAFESYRMTHPSVRNVYSERLDQVALLKMTPKERRKLDVEDSDEAIKTKNWDFDEKLKTAAQSIDAAAALGSLGSGEYNTLILVPRDRSPNKSRKGRDAQLVFFESNTIATQPVKISIDGAELTETSFFDVADIEFQATTRGGRRMDAILDGQAAFRSTTVGVGSLITEIGDNVGGLAGLGVVLLGVAVQAAGGAVSPEADTRCWQTLPRAYDIHALTLPEGNHTIEFQQYTYFERTHARTKHITIADSKDMAVIFAPPPTAGFYSWSCQCGIKLSARDRDHLNDPGPKIIVTPPLGLGRIERFGGDKDREKPEALAPDAKKMMRRVRKALKKRDIPCGLVTHQEIITEGRTLCGESDLAFQVTLVALEKEKSGKGNTYQATFHMNLIDTKTGLSVFSNTITTNHTSKKREATTAFYACLDEAIVRFTSDGRFPDFLKADVAASGGT